jgi:hypothetical protein
VPYRDITGQSWEKATRTGHSRAAMAAVAEAADFYVPAERVEPLDWLDDRCVSRDDLPPPDDSIDKMIALDGSMATVEARAGMPSVLYGFVQASAVLIDLELYEEQRITRFVDPVVLSRAKSPGLVSLDLPVAGAYVSEHLDIKASWRHAIFALFGGKSITVADKREMSLLDILFELHGSPGSPATELSIGTCPHRCGERDIAVSHSPGQCPNCEGTVFPTDILRIADEVGDQGTNQEPLSRLMQAVELMAIGGLLALLWRYGRRHLRELVFVVDGPLAVFGTGAPLKRQILRYFQEIHGALDSGPHIMGVVKSGQFVDFATAVAEHASLDPGTLIRVDDYVIAKVKNNDQPYGRDTYWGRKFFYFTSDQRTIVITTPPDEGDPYQATGDRADPALYSSLGSLLAIVDKTGSSMYRDAVVPVALAHEAAAYPLGVGTDILKLVARRKLRLDD